MAILSDSAGRIAKLQDGTLPFTAIDVNGGAIDATPIGGTTPAAGAFTTLSSSGAATLNSASITTTLGVTGASTLAAMTATTGSFSSTLGVTGVLTASNASNVIRIGTACDLTTPPAIGGATPAAGAFTTLSASGVITSTVTTGTAPFSVASTTVVPNLNVSQLLGATWAAPGTIGSGTPNSGAFTTLTASSTLNVTGASTFVGNVFVGVNDTTAGVFTCYGGTTTGGVLQFYTGADHDTVIDRYLVQAGNTNGDLRFSAVGGSIATTVFWSVDTALTTTIAGLTTTGKELLVLDQNDADQPFIDFQGASGANTTSTVSTLTTSGAVQGHLMIEVNGTKRWIAFLADPS